MPHNIDGAAHRAETRLLKDIFSQIAEGVIVADLDGRFLLFNAAAEKMLGLGAQDVTPDRWTEAYGCYLPDTVTPYPPANLPLARALRGEEITDDVIYIKNPRKPLGIWISLSGKPLVDENGSIWGGFVIIRDISRQTEAERKTYSVSQKLAAVIDNETTAILVENEYREIQSINQAFCDLFEIPVEPHELVGADCSQSAEQSKYLFRDPDGFVERIESLLASRTMITNEKLYLTDGRIFERDYIPLIEQNDYAGHVWQYRDITAREKALQRIGTIERLSSALAQTADSVVITDRHGEVEYVNDAFEKTTGFSRDDVIGRTPRILKSGKHDEEFYRRLWGTIVAGHPFRGTIINRKKTGEFYTAEQTITPIKDHSGEITHYVSVLRDITELLQKKEQEIEMRVAREVQQSFYKARTDVPGFDIAGATIPCTEMGGDYYDFIPMPDDTVCIAIGDVAGHGISSALIMAEMRAAVRSFTSVSRDAGEIMTSINRALQPDLCNGRFSTLILIMLNFREGTMTYANAGHEFGYLLSDTGRIDYLLASTGTPLGVFADNVYISSKPVSLRKGQMILLMTDGITESWNSDGGQPEIGRAISYVVSHRGESALGISEGLCESSKLLADDNVMPDDITAVVLKVL
ncbi:MAG: SpoIIE family protein phosphatase [Candidatus Zixiibacteriota bacterium]|nr:MAG: SpoIIE family protein phosphatase [candidate division Zixibacteria bacterium]